LLIPYIALSQLSPLVANYDLPKKDYCSALVLYIYLMPIWVAIDADNSVVLASKTYKLPV